MKRIIIAILLVITPFSCFSATDVQECQEFILHDQNYQVAHLNNSCILAARAGDGSALYSIGFSYGYSGNSELEKKYYELAANKGVEAAFLALGHIYRGKEIDKSIYWYERFVQTKAQGYGYASLLLARLHANSGDNKASKYWLGVCKSSPYSENCAL